MAIATVKMLKHKVTLFCFVLTRDQYLLAVIMDLHCVCVCVLCMIALVSCDHGFPLCVCVSSLLVGCNDGFAVCGFCMIGTC